MGRVEGFERGLGPPAGGAHAGLEALARGAVAGGFVRGGGVAATGQPPWAIGVNGGARRLGEAFVHYEGVARGEQRGRAAPNGTRPGAWVGAR